MPPDSSLIPVSVLMLISDAIDFGNLYNAKIEPFGCFIVNCGDLNKYKR